MGGKWDDLVETLSAEILKVPQDVLDAAREVVNSESGTTLAEELNRRGCLSDLEHGFLQEVTARLSDPEGLTGTDVRSSAPSCGDADPAERGVPSLTSGDEDRYVRIGEHERGGMGRILNVWDKRMGREVALKELLPGRIERSKKDSDTEAGKSRVIRRFLQEAQVTGRLQHPSIIPVHEIGQRADGSHYYTMKFVRGETLREAIESRPSLEDRLKLLPHFVDVCQAMAYAHANGFIHRDLKPENVMVGEFGETLVIDWGLSKSIGGGVRRPNLPEGVEADFDLATNDGLTVDGTVMGTPYYMAPEQASGRLDDLDERTDIYALGAVLYQLLTGERPFANLSKMDALRKLNEGPPMSLTELCPELPRALTAVCNQAMARDPRERYQTAGEMADEIVTYQTGGLVAAHDYGVGEHIWRFVTQHVAAVVTAAVALCVLIGVVAYAFRTVQHRADAERAARLVAERTTYATKLNIAYREMKDLNLEAAEALAGSLPVALRGWEWGHLHFLMNVRRQGLSQHGALNVPSPDYSNLDLSPDGSVMLTADDSGCVNLWGMAEYRALYTMQTHGQKLLDVKLFSDGVRFASSAIDGEVCVWDGGAARRLADTDIDGEARELIIAPDEDHVLIAGPAAVTSWNWKEGQITGQFYGDGDQMNTVDISPSGRWVAAGDEIGMVYLWDRESGARVFSAMAHPRSGTGNYWGTLDVSFHPKEEVLATSGSDGAVRLWDYNGGILDTFTEAQGKIWSVNWYPDGQRFVTLDISGETMIQVADSRVAPSARIATPFAQEVEFSPDGSQLYIASFGKQILTVRPEDPGARFLTGHRSGLNDLVFGAGSAWLYTVAGRAGEPDDTRVLAWALDSYADMPTWHLPPDFYRSRPLHGWDEARVARVLFDGLSQRGNALALNQESTLLAVGDGGGNVHLIALETGSLDRTISIAGWEDGIVSLDFSPDGSQIALAGIGTDPGQHVKIIGVATGETLEEVGHHQREITHVVYDPNGRYIATGSLDRKICLWATKDGALIDRFERMQQGGEFGFHIARDGAELLYPRAQFGVRRFHLGNRAVTGVVYSGLSNGATSATYSPDEGLVVATSYSETTVWDAQTGVRYFSLPHGAARARFSPDGRILATAGLDGRVGVWHAMPWK